MSNVLLSKLHTPGATFRLPSCGLFYTNNELSPDVIDGEVHVQPMTAYDELLLKSPDLLFSGQGVTKVFERCIPQIKEPLKLLAKDVDFLMACLQHVTYGSQMEINFTHTCENAKKHDYMINLDSVLRTAKTIDPTTVDAVYIEKMPNGTLVAFEPVRFETIVSFLQKMDQNKTRSPEEEFEGMLDAICGVIKNVDGVDDRSMIKEWLSKVSALYVKRIRNCMERIADWGPDFVVTQKCSDCGEDVEISLPLNPISFFI